jgi:predicted DNA-binding transcriptional regulator AlpA
MSDVVVPIDYPSKATMARRLDCCESTVDELVKRGVIPPPIKLSNDCVRWDWAAVRVAIDARKPTAGAAGTAANSDPYSMGARNAAQETAPKGGGPAA